jgi:Cu(I)/Ag(I) efflux system protein CusF
MIKHSIFVVVASFTLVACGQQGRAEQRSASQSPSEPYAGAGKVVAVAGDQITIAHGPIKGAGWPAMTMTFTSPPNLKSNVAAGDQVAFAFRQEGNANVLTSLQKH